MTTLTSTRTRCGLPAICLAVATACATPVSHALTLSLDGLGHVRPIAGPDAGGIIPLVVEPPNDFELGGSGGWQLRTEFDYNTHQEMGSGRFELQRGADGLFGRIDLEGNLALTAFQVTYTVYEGQGAWAGWSGIGSSYVQLVGPLETGGYPFSESGSFNLTLAPVPEPASLAMMLAGIALLVWRRTG